MKLIHGDNLDALYTLKVDAQGGGPKFDLVELDGPYMAGLEDWDNMTEAEYIEHYAARLSLVRDVLQPWGVVFVFGYPEGCAEIKSWAHRTETLYLRRWLTWYKQMTAHKGRKVEAILFFLKDTPAAAAAVAFGAMLRQERERRGWTLRQVGDMVGRPWWHRGGNLYFETGSGGFPSVSDFVVLSSLFGFDPNDWPHVIMDSYEGITETDYIAQAYPEETHVLNGDGLRSKPIGLYLDLFRPTIPPTDTRRALILYGGSGNAGIAAAALGYDVTMCETDGDRCAVIRKRWGREVRRWKQRAEARQCQLRLPEPKQLGLFAGMETT